MIHSFDKEKKKLSAAIHDKITHPQQEPAVWHERRNVFVTLVVRYEDQTSQEQTGRNAQDD